MDEYTLRQELLLGEDSVRQFKRKLPSRDDLPRQISAMLNTRGGKIIIGVTDDGTIIGVPPEELTPTFDNAISNACSTGIKPPCGVTTENLRTEEGLLVVVIDVPDGASKPYLTSNGSLYVKRGADLRKVTEQSEFRRLLLANSVLHTDLQPVAGTSFLDLDYSALKTYYDHKFSDEALADLADEDQLLRQLRGIRLMEADSLTITATLLFAKRPSSLLPSFTIKAIWFDGIDRSSEKNHDSRIFDGTLQAQFEKAMAFLDKWNSRIQKGSFNSSEEEIPSIVFEEILVNALVHRDYAIPDSIKLFIFDDRIEIRSPGALPNSLTEEEALKGIGRDRNSQLEAFAYDLMRYRGARSGLLRARKLIPKITLQNNVEAEEVTVVIPISSEELPRD